MQKIVHGCHILPKIPRHCTAWFDFTKNERLSLSYTHWRPFQAIWGKTVTVNRTNGWRQFAVKSDAAWQKDKQQPPFTVNWHRKPFASPSGVWVSCSTCTRHLRDQSVSERLQLESTLCCQLLHLDICWQRLEISWHYKAKRLQGLQIRLNGRPKTRLKMSEILDPLPLPWNHFYKIDDLKIHFSLRFSIHVSWLNFRGQKAAFTLCSNHTIFYFTLGLIKRERTLGPHFTTDIS